MITIKIYNENTYYQNKWGDKEYLTGSDSDNTLISAALLTGKGLIREEECIYIAYGETLEEAEKSIDNYLNSNPNHPAITNKTIVIS